MGRDKSKETESDRWKKRDKDKSKRQRHRERDPERARGRRRGQAAGTSGATGRGPRMALRIPIWAPLLLMGLLTTGEWDPGLVTPH